MTQTQMVAVVIAGVLLVGMNALSFGLMAQDKKLAKAGKRRIPEKKLFLATALMGGVGGVLGMQLCRHKTKHWYFVWGFPAMMIVQLALLVWAGVCFFG